MRDIDVWQRSNKKFPANGKKGFFFEGIKNSSKVDKQEWKLFNQINSEACNRSVLENNIRRTFQELSVKQKDRHTTEPRAKIALEQVQFRKLKRD